MTEQKVELQRLMEALRSDNESVRYHAAEVLGKIGDAIAVPALIETLGDDSESVRYHVAEALGKIGTLEALQVVEYYNKKYTVALYNERGNW